VFQRQRERDELPDDEVATFYYALRSDEATRTFDFFVTTRTRMFLAPVPRRKRFLASLVGFDWDPAQKALVVCAENHRHLQCAGFHNDFPQALPPAGPIILQCPPGVTDVAAKNWRVILVHSVTPGRTASEPFINGYLSKSSSAKDFEPRHCRAYQIESQPPDSARKTE
jgi:hypothetical protein